MKKIYLLLSEVGLIAPLVLLALFVREYGWNPALFWQQMWDGYVSSLVMADLLLSCVVFWIWMFREAEKYQIARPWLYVVLTLMVGLCFALPLFLYFRQGKIELTTQTAEGAGQMAMGSVT